METQRPAAAAASSAAPSYVVVPGSPVADRDEVLAVWERSGFGAISAEQQRKRYDWFYLNNPQGTGQVSFLSREGDDTRLGFLGVGARDWMIDERPAKGGVLVDFVVHPEHRTAAPALMLQRKGRERAGEFARILTGLPDTKAVAVFKRLGSQFHCQLPRYVRIVRYRGYLLRHLPEFLATLSGGLLSGLDALLTAVRLLGSTCSGQWVERFDERFDALWARAAKRKRCIGLRDARFLEWRFARQPGHEYRTFAVTGTSAAHLRSYFVCEMSADSLVVKDLCGDGDERSYRDGLLLLTQAARKLGAAAVSVQVCGDPALREALRATQFVERDARPFFAMVAAPERDSIGELAWYITQADEDI